MTIDFVRLSKVDRTIWHCWINIIYVHCR